MQKFSKTYLSQNYTYFNTRFSNRAIKFDVHLRHNVTVWWKGLRKCIRLLIVELIENIKAQVLKCNKTGYESESNSALGLMGSLQYSLLSSLELGTHCYY